MGQREDMLLALGVDPSMVPADPRGIAPPPEAQGLIDTYTQTASDRASRFRDIVNGAAGGHPLMASAPGIKAGLDAVGAATNPIGLAAGLAGNTDVARRAGQSAIGLPHDAIGVGHSPAPPGLARIVENANGVQPMASDVTVRPAPTLASQGSPARPMGGGMGGSGGSGLERNLRDAQGREMQGFDDMSGLQEQLGQDRAGAVLLESDMREADARNRIRAAEEQARIEADTHQIHTAYLARQEQLADEIGKQGVDPGRYLRNADLGTQVTFGLGSALGEMFSSDGKNHFLDRVDKMIEQDVMSQVAGNDAKRESYKARSSLFDKMLAESGDRRLAGMQTQKMLYDAIDRKLTADAARLGVPEIMTGAKIKSQEYQQKKQILDVQIQQASLQRAQAQAAAQAAAQRAAEERLRQHTIEMIKLEQEQQKIEISRGGKDGDINKQTQQLGEKLSDKDLAEGRGAVEAAKRRLAGLKPDEGLPGVGPMADARAGLHPSGIGGMIAGGAPGLLADKVFGLSDTERVSRGDWDKIKLAYQKQITGSGASEGERKMLTAAFEGARSPAEQRNAIAQADDYFTRRESAIKAGFDPKAVATFEARQGAINPQMPAGAKEKR